MLDRRQRRRHKAAKASAFFAVAILCFAASWVLPGWLAISGALISLAAGVFALNDRGAVPVLVYHSVSDAPDWLPWAENTSIRPQVFQAHLNALRRGGWTVVPSQEIFAALADRCPLPSRALALHFDDGYLDNHVAVAPMLRAAKMPATFFVSRDFIDPSEEPRPQLGSGAVLTWDGYMNKAELSALDADPLFEVACHGTDHGRVATGPAPIDTLTVETWKQHAPWLWAQTPGNKAGWYKETDPVLPYGTPVPETDSALCAGSWGPGQDTETEASWHARVVDDLSAARQCLTVLLGRDVRFLCWPFDRVTPNSLKLARAAGFTHFTGGRGENRIGEDPAVLSRVHVNDRATGYNAPLWVEALVFRARLGVAAGELWWLPVTWAAARLRTRRYAIDHAPPDMTGESEAA